MIYIFVILPYPHPLTKLNPHLFDTTNTNTTTSTKQVNIGESEVLIYIYFRYTPPPTPSNGIESSSVSLKTTTTTTLRTPTPVLLHLPSNHHRRIGSDHKEKTLSFPTPLTEAGARTNKEDDVVVVCRLMHAEARARRSEWYWTGVNGVRN